LKTGDSVATNLKTKFARGFNALPGLGGFGRTSLVSPVLAVVLAFSLNGAAMAAPLTLAKSGELAATQPVARIGRLLLPQGQVKVRGREVEVMAVPEWLFDRHAVLKGKLIKADAGSQALTALVYFDNGDWLKDLYSGRRSRETFTLKNGSNVYGNVRSITPTDVSIEVLPGKIEKIGLSEIVSIDSPFAYQVTISLRQVQLSPETQELTAEGGTTVLKPVSVVGSRIASKKDAVLPPSRLPGTEGGITKGKIASMVAMDTVNTLAPLVAIPLVVPLGERSAIRQLNAYQQADIANVVFDLPAVPQTIARF